MGKGSPALIGGSGLLVTTAVVLAISVIVGTTTTYGLVYIMSLVFAVAITIAEQWLLRQFLSNYTTGISYTYNAKTGLSKIQKEKIGTVAYTSSLWDLPSTAAQLITFATTYWTYYSNDSDNELTEEDSSYMYSIAAWSVAGVLLTYSVYSRIVTLEQCTLGIIGGTFIGAQGYNISKSIIQA